MFLDKKLITDLNYYTMKRLPFLIIIHKFRQLSINLDKVFYLPGFSPMCKVTEIFST